MTEVLETTRKYKPPPALSTAHTDGLKSNDWGVVTLLKKVLQCFDPIRLFSMTILARFTIVTSSDSCILQVVIISSHVQRVHWS